MSTWTNNDGLYIKYGTTEAALGRGGEDLNFGDHVLDFSLDLTAVTAVASPLILDDAVTIPVGAQIDKVVVTVEEVTAGTNSNLDLGLIDQDRSTEIDFNGLLTAADGWHTSAIGTVTEYTAGGTDAGADLGTVVTNAGLVCANYDTAAFTDGTLRIQIFYHIP